MNFIDFDEVIFDEVSVSRNKEANFFGGSTTFFVQHFLSTFFFHISFDGQSKFSLRMVVETNPA
jgi:hypothetical protein